MRQKLIGVGILIGSLGCQDFLPDFGIPLYTFGYVPVLAMVCFWAYAILRYRLVDVTPSFAIEQIIGTMAEALLVVDNEGVVRVTNASAESLFNHPSGSLTGLALSDASRGLFSLKQMESMIQDGPFRDREVTYSSPDGKNLCLNVSASIALDQARQPAAFVLLLKDVSERKKLEVAVLQSEKMSAVGQLAAGVAHEINNPLGVILGFAQELVRRLQANDPLELPLKSIEKEAIRCKNLVQDLLTFSRASKTDREPVDINRAVEGALSLIMAQARVAHIEVKKEFSPDFPRVLGNQNQLQQVIINLANNAMDAMGNSGVLTFKTECVQEGALSWVCLRVIDTGPGIPAEIRSRIFDPFFTTKPVGKGTGLGLSLVHEIIQKHSGLISVESRPGRTEFLVKLPIRLKNP